MAVGEHADVVALERVLESETADVVEQPEVVLVVAVERVVAVGLVVTVSHRDKHA